MALTDVTTPPEAVTPLIRGLAVLRRIAESGGRRSVTDLVRTTGLARATIDRVLGTLEQVGHVRVEDRDAVLAPRLMELGNAYLAASRLPDLLGPRAEELADALDEPVSVAVPDGCDARVVYQARRRRAISLTFRIGDLLPAERSAPGALLAAGWSSHDWRRWRSAADSDGGSARAASDIEDAAASFRQRVTDARRRGWTIDDQLIEPGLIALALPVGDLGRTQACAVTVVSHTSRHTTASLRRLVLPRLRETTLAMERALAIDSTPTGSPLPDVSPASSARASKRELGTEFVESLARGLAVITAFGSGRTELPLTAVAQTTGLARATARRSLITLQHLGYVTCAGRLFRLTPRVLELGFAPLSDLTLPAIGQPHLRWLAAQVHESASMAVLDGDDIRYVARVPTVRIMSVDITVGTRFPAYATSMGRTLLAGLPPAERAARLAGTELRPLTPRTITSAGRLAAVLDGVERDGYAFVDEELEEGLRSVAVPVRDRGGRIVAAINVSTHASRRTAEQACDDLLPTLRAAAERIERDLHIVARYVPVSAG